LANDSESISVDHGSNSGSKDQVDSKSSLGLIEDLYDDTSAGNDSNMLIAVHDFEPEHPGQLSLKRGDKVQIKQYNNAGNWCEGEKESGVKGWIPTANLAKSSDLEQHSWFHGLLPRKEAENRLCSGINGSFLIRESETRPGQYSMSLRNDGKTYHYRISSGKDYYCIDSGPKFPTLQLLVRYHSIHSDGLITTIHYPAVNPTKLPLFHDVDQWEMDRSDLVIGAKLDTGRCGRVYKASLKSKEKTVAVKTFKVFHKVNFS